MKRPRPSQPSGHEAAASAPCAVLDDAVLPRSLALRCHDRLLVRLPVPGPKGFGQSEQVTFIPARSDCPKGGITRPESTAVFRFAIGFIARASGIVDADLRGGSGTSHKISALAASVWRAELSAGAIPIVRHMLWTALARSIAVSFGDQPQRDNDGWLNPGALQRVVSIVEEELSGKLPIGRLADAAGLSASAFLRAFRGSTGLTPGEYILGRRVALGAELLATTDLPVAVVAARAGFKSSNHFATTFAARRGLSPSAHRRRTTTTV